MQIEVMNQMFFFVTLMFVSLSLNAQKISGRFSLFANQNIKLEGFRGLKSYTIGDVYSDNYGNFSISYNNTDQGIGYLITSEQKPFFVILTGEEIVLEGESINNVSSTRVKLGKENQWFEKYSLERLRREQALSAWTYLKNVYSADSLFVLNKDTRFIIDNEIQRINQEDDDFLENLPASSFIKWYLTTRKLISSAPTLVRGNPKNIPAILAAFRKFDYADDRLFKSGLLRDAIETHYWLIENSNLSEDSLNSELQLSINILLKQLSHNEKKLNEIINHLFQFLESRGYFKAAELLSLILRDEVGCTIEPDLARQLESYRAMRVGNSAADFTFAEDTEAPGYLQCPYKLSELKSYFTLIVFGASWCPQCTIEIPSIASKYAKWKQKGIEVVFVSLDDNKFSFKKFIKDFPFISTCDYKKWDGPIVSSYYVYATPTFFLLDKDRKIVLRPNNLQQIDEWVDRN